MVALDYENGKKSNTPDLKYVNKLNEIKIKRDGQSSLSNAVSDKLNPDLNSIVNKENTKMKSKKIVNNMTSQYGPILGVNFHKLGK